MQRKIVLTLLSSSFNVLQRKERETTEGCSVVLVIPNSSVQLHWNNVFHLQEHDNTIRCIVFEVCGCGVTVTWSNYELSILEDSRMDTEWTQNVPRGQWILSNKHLLQVRWSCLKHTKCRKHSELILVMITKASLNSTTRLPVVVWLGCSGSQCWWLHVCRWVDQHRSFLPRMSEGRQKRPVFSL